MQIANSHIVHMYIMIMINKYSSKLLMRSIETMCSIYYRQYILCIFEFTRRIPVCFGTS